MFLKKSNKLAIVDFDGTKISHTALVNNVKYYSKYIIKSNNEKEFNIIMLENSTKWIYSFYSIWNNKCVPVTIDAMSSSKELEYFLKDSKATKIIVSNNTIDVAKEAIANVEFDVEILNTDEFEVDKLKLDDIEKEQGELLTPLGDDLAVMLYTSGTTGDPKGVMLTFNNIIHQIESIRGLDITGETEQILSVLPYHHILPLMSTNLFFLYYKHQYSIVLLEKLVSQEILKALANNDVTILSMVPRVYKLFYKSIKDQIDAKWYTRLIYKIMAKINNRKLSRIVFKKVHDKFGGKLTRLISGGAKTELEIIRFFDAIGFEYCEGYGLTETSPVIAGATPNHGKKVGTVGRHVDNVEIKVVDGELWVKGPIVMKGYLNKPEKTKEVITEDGWFKTGDLVDIDSEGYITILGRKNAMIVLSNGKNIDPESLENKISLSSNGIFKEVGVFGNNDKLTALLVLDKDEVRKHNISNIHAYVKDIIEFYNASVHNYEKILEYKITENELPKTRIGKIRRFMLKDVYLGNINQEEKKVKEEPKTKEYEILKNFVYNVKGEYPDPDKNLEIEFGFDSLDQVELLTFIESSFSIKMTEEEFKENMTLEKLSKLVGEKSNQYLETTNQWSEIISNAKGEEIKDGWLIKFFRPLAYIILKIYFRIKITGSDKIKEEQQIFVANHESFIDALALNLLIPNKIAQKTHSLAINWYFKNKFMKYVAKNGNVLLLDIDKNIKDTIIQLSNAIKKGKNIFIFPEGTRTKDGNIGEFKKVFAIISKELNIKVTCLKIDGAYNAYSRYMSFPRPKKIEVKYLGQIDPKNLTYNEIVEKAVSMYK